MPKVFTSETQRTGEIGENIAVRFLMKQGFLILDRNYTRKWGEIDIVAENKGKLYFIEVKSIQVKEQLGGLTSKQVGGESSYRPEDNMHPWKLKRLSRAIQTYLLQRNVDEDMEWQVDLLVVFLDMKERKARIK